MHWIAPISQKLDTLADSKLLSKLTSTTSTLKFEFCRASLKQSIEDSADEDFKFKNKLPLGNKVTNLVLSTELVGDSFITETKLQENPVTLGDKLAEKLGIPEINFVQIISELKRSFDNKPETIVNL